MAKTKTTQTKKSLTTSKPVDVFILLDNRRFPWNTDRA